MEIKEEAAVADMLTSQDYWDHIELLQDFSFSDDCEVEYISPLEIGEGGLAEWMSDNVWGKDGEDFVRGAQEEFAFELACFGGPFITNHITVSPSST